MSRMAMWCPRCNQVHERGQRCPLRSKPRRSQPGKHNSAYDDAEYRRARRQALERTKGKCARCGKVIARRDGHGWRMLEGGVHHIRTLRDGGGHQQSNLAPLCDDCHLFMHR